jgi:hypothetical protein
MRRLVAYVVFWELVTACDSDHAKQQHKGCSCGVTSIMSHYFNQAQKAIFVLAPQLATKYNPLCYCCPGYTARCSVSPEAVKEWDTYWFTRHGMAVTAEKEFDVSNSVSVYVQGSLPDMARRATESPPGSSYQDALVTAGQTEMAFAASAPVAGWHMEIHAVRRWSMFLAHNHSPVSVQSVSCTPVPSKVTHKSVL